MLLPLVDETALYNAYNFNVGICYYNDCYGAAANSTVTLSVLAQYTCPSDGGPEVYANAGVPNLAVRASSYVGNWGVNDKRGDLSHHSGFGDGDYGPFSPMSRVRIRDIRDGTSQTLAAGEQADAPAPPADPNNPRRAHWAFGKRGLCLSGTLYPMGTTVFDNTVTDQVFRSPHEGGAFFVFCDGQVRFLSENIDMGTYRALSTIANNEIVDDEDY